MGMNSDLRSIKYKMDFQIFQIHFMYAILESFFYSILSELLFFLHSFNSYKRVRLWWINIQTNIFSFTKYISDASSFGNSNSL